MKYVPALDGIRALAIVLVLGFHAKVPGFGGGFLGVDVFFVLSGYLITRLLVAEHQRTGSLAVMPFYGRRLRRLYPPMLFMLAVFVAVAPFAFPQRPYELHLRDALLSVLYLTDYAKAMGLPTDVILHTWSLSIEEHFYLVWPLVLLGVLRLQPRQAMWAMICLFFALTMWRYVNVDPGYPWNVYRRFDTHMTGLVLGCLAGYANFRLRPIWGAVGVACLLAFVTMLPRNEMLTAQFGFTLVEFASLLIVCAQPATLGAPVLAWLGRMSYGLYLWHYPIMRWMRFEQWGWAETMVVGSAAGVAMASLSYYTVERRFRKSRRVDRDADGIDVVVIRRARSAPGSVV